MRAFFPMNTLDQILYRFLLGQGMAKYGRSFVKWNEGTPTPLLMDLLHVRYIRVIHSQYNAIRRQRYCKASANYTILQANSLEFEGIIILQSIFLVLWSFLEVST